MKSQIQGFKEEEGQKIKSDEAQIAEVKALLEKLEESKRKRELNIAAYAQKMIEIEKEKSDWDKQRAAMTQLKTELELKEQEALAEQKKWDEKKKSYSAETDKWQKASRSAEQIQAKYKRLAE